MPTASAISLTLTQRKEKRVLTPFSGAFFPGELRRIQRGQRAASRGLLAND